MAKTIYIIRLSEEERSRLRSIVDSNSETERAKTRAQILLLSDISVNGKEYTVQELEEIIGTTHTTIMTTRTAYVDGGLEAAVFRKGRTIPADKQKIRDNLREQVLVLKNENPPNGKKAWTLRLLCEEAQKRGIVDKISPASMMRLLSENEQ